MRCFHFLTVAVVLGCAGSAFAANILSDEIYNSSNGYGEASSIPVNTFHDVILGMSPISTNYVGDNEASGGTTAPLRMAKLPPTAIAISARTPRLAMRCSTWAMATGTSNINCPPARILRLSR